MSIQPPFRQTDLGKQIQAIRARAKAAKKKTPFVKVAGEVIRRRAWTNFEEAKLRKMWAAGEFVLVIAAELNREEDAIHAKASRLGLPRRHNRNSVVSAQVDSISKADYSSTRYSL